ncbi:hypothetical protein ACHAXT_006861 [Thalassiosira profunda]
MRASLGWIVLVQLLLWPSPLAAAQSLRGGAAAVEDGIDPRRGASFVDIDNESAGPARVKDAAIEETPHERRARSRDALVNESAIPAHVEDAAIEETPHERRARSQDALVVSSNSTIDQYHRDERGIFRPEPRIIGGTAAVAPTSGPALAHVVLLDRNGNPFCGGSLISLDVVFTAAHCTHQASGKGPIEVVVGRPTLSDESQGEILGVRAEYVHPGYDIKSAHQKWNYDFGLLFLRRPAKVPVQIMKLNKDPRLPRGGSTVRVWGHGDTEAHPDVKIMSDTLQVARLRMMSNQQCNAVTGRFYEYHVSYHGFIKDDMMCARNRKRDSCQGDSGGALTWKGMQVGITSWGVECNNRHFPGVYARTSAAHQWTKRNVCSRSMYPDKQFNCEPW